MKARPAALIPLALASTAALVVAVGYVSSRTAASSGVRTSTTTLADQTIIHRGSNLPASAKPPLVVMLGHSSSAGVEAQTHWVEAADTYNLAVAIPQGNDKSLGWSDRSGELALLEQNIPTWISNLGADPNRVYLAGFSSGANMAFYAASHASDAQLPLAGIAPVSGWMNRGYALPRQRGVRLFYVLGSVDVLGPAGDAIFNSMDEVAGIFTARNGCAGSRAQQSTSDVLQQKSWPCAVDNYVVNGGGHCWPVSWATGPGCHAPDLQISATDLIAKWVLQGPTAPPPVAPVRASTGLTPGATNPAVRQSSIGATICRRGWVSRVKPTSAYLNSLKLKQMRQYQESGPPSTYLEDHLIPLELGGAPKNPKNLWPEPIARAQIVDNLEHQLNRQVCTGVIKLATARIRIAKLKHTQG